MTVLHHPPDTTELTEPLDYDLTSPRNEKRHKPRRTRRWIVWIVSLLVWGSLTYGGFAFAKQYMDEFRDQLGQIQNYTVELTNTVESLQKQLALQQETAVLLQLKFEEVQRELEGVQLEMSVTGDSLNAGDDTRQALSERISDLSSELDDLRKLIKRLEDAARVY